MGRVSKKSATTLRKLGYSPYKAITTIDPKTMDMNLKKLTIKTKRKNKYDLECEKPHPSEGLKLGSRSLTEMKQY